MIYEILVKEKQDKNCKPQRMPSTVINPQYTEKGLGRCTHVTTSEGGGEEEHLPLFMV